MDENGLILDLLERLRGILIFLVTTEPGWILIGVLLAGYLFLAVHFRIRGLDSRGPASWIGAFFLELAGLAGRTLSALPTLLGVLLIIGILISATEGIEEFGEYFENRKEIQRLEKALKHLENRHRVARVQVSEQDRGITSLVIDFYDRKGTLRDGETQEISIKGRDIYFDSVVLNFEFSEVEAGKRNLALPYRVFSEEVPASRGIPLRIYNQDRIPFLYERGRDEIYGIEPAEYREAVRQVTGYLKEPEAARAAGVRTTYGNAVHRIVEEGDSFIVWIEQTGGIVIKEPRNF